MKTKVAVTSLDDNQLREIILKYLFNRNKKASSRMGKNGSYVKISDLKSELKKSNSLKQAEVIGNLNYLISQGWVEEKIVEKMFVTKQGHSIPSETEYYCITADGIDKIDGPSIFTKDRFAGIKIEATGQNIITLGNGNQINVKYQKNAEALNELRIAITKCEEIDASTKLEMVSDIDTIQDQLAKSIPNKTVVKALWENVNRAASIASLTDVFVKVSPFIISLFQ